MLTLRSFLSGQWGQVSAILQCKEDFYEMLFYNVPRSSEMCWVLRNHGITSQWPGFVTKRHRRLEQPSNPSIKSHWSKAVRFGTRATPSRMFWSRPQKSDIFRATKYEKGLKKGVIRIFFRNMQWNKVMWAPSIPGHCWRWRKAVSKSRENESFCDSFWHGAVGLCFLLLCMGGDTTLKFCIHAQWTYLPRHASVRNDSARKPCKMM